MERERERVDRARNDLRARTRSGEGGGERAAARALHVDADGQSACISEGVDEVGCLVRLERAGRVVQQDPHGAELGQRLRALDEDVSVTGRSGAVHETGLEVAIGGRDGLGGLAQVGHVVEWVVEAEDVDAVLRRRGDEAAREVGVDWSRADQEPAPEGEAERRLRAGLQRTDALPRALDSALDGRVEAPAARDLQVGEARFVEDLGQPQLLGGGHPAGERLLSEQANRGVGEHRHGWDLTGVQLHLRQAERACGCTSRRFYRRSGSQLASTT